MPPRKLATLTLEQKVAVAKWLRTQPRGGAGTERAAVVEWIEKAYGVVVSVETAGCLRSNVDTLLEKAESAGAHQLGATRPRRSTTSCSKTRRLAGTRTCSTSSSAPPTPQRSARRRGRPPSTPSSRPRRGPSPPPRHSLAPWRCRDCRSLKGRDGHLRVESLESRIEGVPSRQHGGHLRVGIL